VLSILGRSLVLLQRYPIALLLPTVAIVVAGVGIDRIHDGPPLSEFSQFLIAVAALSCKFLLFCIAFLCVANYAVGIESKSRPPELRDLLNSLKLPGGVKLLAGLLARFALTIVVVFAVMIVLVPHASRVFTAHSSPRLVSSTSFGWIAIVLAILILSRWILAIPLFVRSEGLLRLPFARSAKAIQGCRMFAVIFTLAIEVASHPLARLTSRLHPHVTDGATRYVPQVFEIVAAHGFQAVAWSYWMVVMTMLVMGLQSHDEPVPAAPLAVA
jgi:hypothetical protein